MEKSLALTPPIGWNSWNMFGDRVSETVIRETADALVASRLRDCGYEYHGRGLKIGIYSDAAN
jgi:alpha-galactosidase